MATKVFGTLGRKRNKLSSAVAGNLSVGDRVVAQWEDKEWYEARIEEVLVNQENKVKYQVYWIEYDESTTVSASRVRKHPDDQDQKPKPSSSTAALASKSSLSGTAGSRGGTAAGAAAGAGGGARGKGASGSKDRSTAGGRMKKGTVVVAEYSNGEWIEAKITGVRGSGEMMLYQVKWRHRDETSTVPACKVRQRGSAPARGDQGYDRGGNSGAPSPLNKIWERDGASGSAARSPGKESLTMRMRAESKSSVPSQSSGPSGKMKKLFSRPSNAANDDDNHHIIIGSPGSGSKKGSGGGIKSPLAGHGPVTLRVGEHCDALFTLDGSWGEAVVDEVCGDGVYKVTFVEWDQQDQVHITAIRPRAKPSNADNTKDEKDTKKRLSRSKSGAERKHGSRQRRSGRNTPVTDEHRVLKPSGSSSSYRSRKWGWAQPGVACDAIGDEGVWAPAVVDAVLGQGVFRVRFTSSNCLAEVGTNSIRKPTD